MLLKTLLSAAKNCQRLAPLTIKPAGDFPKLSTASSRLLNSCVDRSFSSSTPLATFNYSGLLTANSSSHQGLLQTKPVALDVNRWAHIFWKRQNIKFSKKKGKRKTVKVVLQKFYRLDWGCWIHGKCGRTKGLYKKSAPRRRRLQQHVMSNATQSWLLDKMVTRYWRKPKHYVDDPYEPYHSREEYKHSRRKPWQPSLL